MSLPYSVALEKLYQMVPEQHHYSLKITELVPLEEAVGRIAAHDYVNAKATPELDTSAMDGYAISSWATVNATVENPAIFKVQGTLAAGDESKQIQESADSDIQPCFEIMTGAVFPKHSSTLKMDACVKVEDTIFHEVEGDERGTYIRVVKRVPENANKRFAGDDIKHGQLILKKGHAVRLSHVMPLASVGFDTLCVLQKLRVGVFSTGKELINGQSNTKDVNGPYLMAALQDLDVENDFLGTLDDHPDIIENVLHAKINSDLYDVIITTGGVSVGKFDYISQVLSRINTEIVFHGLDIRPGHPVLFGTTPSLTDRKVAFFGLPGNPGAAAACFRFLVVPYLLRIRNQGSESPILAKLINHQRTGDMHTKTSNFARDLFRHGVLRKNTSGEHFVEVNKEQSPAKLQPFINSNCWVHFERGVEYHEADLINCYSLSPTVLPLLPI